MIIKGFDDGYYSIRHVHQFSRQHAMVFCPDENGADNVHVTSPNRCIPTKKKKPPGQQKLTRTAQSSRNESVSSLSSSRETPIKSKKINPFLHPPAPLSQHRHNYSLRIKIPAEHRVSTQADGLTVCCPPSCLSPASVALPSLTGHPFSDGPS